MNGAERRAAEKAARAALILAERDRVDALREDVAFALRHCYYARTIEPLRAVLAIDPSRATDWATLGWVLAHVSSTTAGAAETDAMLAEAKAAARRALRLRPSDARSVARFAELVGFAERRRLAAEGRRQRAQRRQHAGGRDDG